MTTKKTIIMLAALAIGLGGQALAADRTATLTTTATTKYQYIDGFGGTGMNGQWGDVYTQQKVNLLWGTGEGQVGLNIMRVRVNPNENNWGEYGNPIRWARQINPRMQVFATPWTPPKKYKTQNTTKYQNDFGTWVWPLVEHSWGGQGSNGGAINPAYYDEYADFLERYRQTMEQKGAPIDMISIQNESDYTPTATDNGVEHASYESCIYSPTEMAAMCKALRQRLDPKCKVMGPECFGWGQHTYNNKLVTLQDALDNIDVWGNHLYGTNDWSFVQNVTKKTGKRMWETEFLIDYADGYGGAFSAEYAMIESIEKAMKAGYSAYVYYSMTNDFFACNHGGSDAQLWKRAWVFSHYAKYATGKTRVYSSLSATNNVLKGGSAYISAQGDSVVVMVLNTSTTDTYNLTVSLPFAPARITQVATSDAANARRADVTEKFGNGTQKPVVKLLPGVFYTFVFEKDADGTPQESVLATSAKQPEYANPLWANRFMADPTAIEYDGRLYVYATNDQQEFDFCDGLSSNTYSHITQLACLSTADLVNWTHHGVIDVKAAAPWIWASWAPSIVSRQEADGQTHFYLYFTNGAAGIGVLTATSPTGPWTDPLGHALIDGSTPGLGTISNIIDPGACIKPDGSEAYLTFGGGDIVGTALQPGNARIVKLGADMISLDGDIKTISAPCHFEANELNYVGSRWVFSYCTRWTIASDWSAYSSTATAPGAASIVHLTASDPLADNWSYGGVVLPNPGTLGYPYGNNHSHLHSFAGQYYLIYHTQWLESQMGCSGGYRNLQLSPVTVAPRTGRISTLTRSGVSISGVDQLASARINPFVEQSGAMAAVAADNWWMVRGVNFNANNQTARSLVVRVKGMGRLEVKCNLLTAAPLAVVEFNAQEEQTVAVDLASVPTGLCDYLYFALPLSADAQVLSWRFSAEPAVGIRPIFGLPSSVFNAVYDLQGRRTVQPRRGISIIRRADGTVQKVIR
ncbi:MAG: family 43 glycosylhydrolase [Prevotella sp.]|nr:family 43 glycosylhydrolase [Prevotella sp.]